MARLLARRGSLDIGHWTSGYSAVLPQVRPIDHIRAIPQNRHRCRSDHPNVISRLHFLAYGKSTLQGITCNFIFTHECDARMRLCVCNELFEHLGPRRATRYAIMRADRHNATTGSGHRIERIELRFEVVGVHGCAEIPGFIIHDVIHVERVGHNSKGFAADINQEWLVTAHIVNMVDETERLKNFQSLRSASQPEGVEADRTRTRCSLNALDTLLIRGALFLRSHRVLRGPGLPVSGCFVPTLNDLLCERRVQVHCCADHM